MATIPKMQIYRAKYCLSSPTAQVPAGYESTRLIEAHTLHEACRLAREYEDRLHSTVSLMSIELAKDMMPKGK